MVIERMQSEASESNGRMSYAILTSAGVTKPKSREHAIKAQEAPGCG